MNGFTAHFTGHRPNKLSGGYNLFSHGNLKLGREIRDILIALIDNYNIKHLIFGGALGIDQLSCLVALKLRDETYNDLIIEIAMPYDNMERKWSDDDKQRHYDMLKRANKVTIVDILSDYKFMEEGTYNPRKLQVRNEYMIDKSHLTIAVWDNINQGGTFNCIQSAFNKGNEVLILPIDQSTRDLNTIEFEDILKRLKSNEIVFDFSNKVVYNNDTIGEVGFATKIRNEYGSIKRLVETSLEQQPELRDLDDTKLYFAILRRLGIKTLSQAELANVSIVTVHKTRQIIQNKERKLQASENTKEIREEKNNVCKIIHSEYK